MGTNKKTVVEENASSQDGLSHFPRSRLFFICEVPESHRTLEGWRAVGLRGWEIEGTEGLGNWGTGGWDRPAIEYQDGSDHRGLAEPFEPTHPLDEDDTILGKQKKQEKMQVANGSLCPN